MPNFCKYLTINKDDFKRFIETQEIRHFTYQANNKPVTVHKTTYLYCNSVDVLVKEAR